MNLNVLEKQIAATKEGNFQFSAYCKPAALLPDDAPVRLQPADPNYDEIHLPRELRSVISKQVQSSFEDLLAAPK